MTLVPPSQNPSTHCFMVYRQLKSQPTCRETEAPRGGPCVPPGLGKDAFCSVVRGSRYLSSP